MDIFNIICKYFEFTPEEIKSKKKGTKIVMARNFIWLFYTEIMKFSPGHIAKKLNKDRTLYYHSINTIRFDVKMNYNYAHIQYCQLNDIIEEFKTRDEVQNELPY